MERRRPWHPFRQPGFCGLRGTLCCLITITLLIVFPIIWYEMMQSPPVNGTTNDISRQTRKVGTLSTKNIRPVRTTIHCTEGQTCVAQFDLCLWK